MTELASFRSAVETFIVDHGWTPTRFGKEAASDPLFVFQLREGREPRSALRDRVRSFMADAPSPAAPIPPKTRTGSAGAAA